MVEPPSRPLIYKVSRFCRLLFFEGFWNGILRFRQMVVFPTLTNRDSAVGAGDASPSI
ncbi:hypothetical protein MPLB_670019 [Mesorhizobium sp. ORS 3324]|nr:hypothetical protein MPLB_670019 [Mesorhizobium sp. ORS 3324]